MQPVILRTARLTLSVPTEADVDAIFEACQDADIQRYTTVPSPYERQHAAGFIPFARDRWSEGVEATWAIRDGDSLAGMIGLHGISLGGAGELGYWMAAPVASPGAAHRGRPRGHRLGLQHLRGRSAAHRMARGRRQRRRRPAPRAPSDSATRACCARRSVELVGRDDGWVAGLLAHRRSDAAALARARGLSSPSARPHRVGG